MGGPGGHLSTVQECTNVVKAVYAYIVNISKCWLGFYQAHLYDVLLKIVIIYYYRADMFESCPSLYTCVQLLLSWLIAYWLMNEYGLH